MSSRAPAVMVREMPPSVPFGEQSSGTRDSAEVLPLPARSVYRPRAKIPVQGDFPGFRVQVPPRTRIPVRFPLNKQHLNTHPAAGPHGVPGPRPRSRLQFGRQL